jgi:hypothetical protein
MAGLSVVPMESALSANTPAIGAHERAEVGNELQSVLLDLIDLSLLGKQLPSRGTIRGTKRTGLHLPAAGPGGNAAQSQSRLNSCQTGHPGHCQLPLHTREVATDASADGLDRQQRREGPNRYADSAGSASDASASASLVAAMSSQSPSSGSRTSSAP